MTADQRKTILERRSKIASLFHQSRKAVKTSVKEVKDQNKNEKYLDNRGKNWVTIIDGTFTFGLSKCVQDDACKYYKLHTDGVCQVYHHQK